MSLKKLLEEKLKQALGDLGLSFEPGKIRLELPKNPEHGDWSSNAAFLLAKTTGETPPKLAEKISRALGPKLKDLAEALPAGPYLNFKIKPAALWREVLTIDAQYGRSSLGAGQKILLEFVSANPTGPLHIGHGRWAAIGDSLARILAAAGFKVEKEYFINDVGRQVELLAESVKAVQEGRPVPENGYQGFYVKEVADKIKSRELKEIQKQAIDYLIIQQKKVLEKFRVNFDHWFSEAKLHASGEVAEALGALGSAGGTYEKDGAVWFKSTDSGDDKDRVLVREDKRPTYFLSDIAYHWDKIRRGYNLLINIWGADHHGYVPRLSAAYNSLPVKNKPELKIIVGQLVSLFSSGEPVRMSKRTGEMITLEEVIDEIGADAGRYLLVRSSPNIHLDFDLDLAKKHSDDNPVYYVQYAHARISSIFEKQKEKNIFPKAAGPATDYNFNQFERDLMKKLVSWPDELEAAAQNLETARLPRLAEELANVFHIFYHNCQVLDEKELLRAAVRLKLAKATKKVLADILNLLGVEAPEKM